VTLLPATVPVLAPLMLVPAVIVTVLVVAEVPILPPRATLVAAVRPIAAALIDPEALKLRAAPELTVALVAAALPRAPSMAIPLPAEVVRLITLALIALFIVRPVPAEAVSAKVKLVLAAPVTAAAKLSVALTEPDAALSPRVAPLRLSCPALPI